MIRITRDARDEAYVAINRAHLFQNWHLGRIISDRLGGDRADDVDSAVSEVSAELVSLFESDDLAKDLKLCLRFYRTYSELRPRLEDDEWVPKLSWAHYRALLRIEDDDDRRWFEEKTIECTWSVLELNRRISDGDRSVQESDSQYTIPYLRHWIEFIRNPKVLHFLGLKLRMDYANMSLEKKIHMAVMESILRGSEGYAFCFENKSLDIGGRDCLVDLVFFNYDIKNFLLIKLQEGEPGDEEASDMKAFIKAFDKMHKRKDHNPTIGLVVGNVHPGFRFITVTTSFQSERFLSNHKALLPNIELFCLEIEAQLSIHYADHLEDGM